jgi:outer membrane protein OmpA-like peptidoglycan-associated protein
VCASSRRLAAALAVALLAVGPARSTDVAFGGRDLRGHRQEIRDATQTRASGSEDLRGKPVSLASSPRQLIGSTMQLPGRGLVNGLETKVPFAFANDHPASRAPLAALARRAGRRRTIFVSVGGHADWVGETKDNFDLSARRAATVCVTLLDLLRRPPRRCDAQAYGELAPTAPNQRPDGTDDPHGRALNRRAEVIIIVDST